MPSAVNAALAAMLGRCPDHPAYIAEAHGRCCICELTTHPHLRRREAPSPEAVRMKAHMADVVGRIEARERNMPGMDRIDDDAEGRWDGVDERIWE